MDSTTPLHDAGHAQGPDPIPLDEQARILDAAIRATRRQPPD